MKKLRIGIVMALIGWGGFFALGAWSSYYPPTWRALPGVSRGDLLDSPGALQLLEDNCVNLDTAKFIPERIRKDGLVTRYIVIGEQTPGCAP